jgi:hypothetical protein
MKRESDFGDPSALLRMTMPPALSLYSVEGLLENFDIARATNLLTRPARFSAFSRASLVHVALLPAGSIHLW